MATPTDQPQPAGTAGTAVDGATPGTAVPPRVQLPVERMPRTATVIRIATMAKEVLEETRQAPLDRRGRARLREGFDALLGELAGCLPPQLAAELGRLVEPISGSAPSRAELRVALAQLAGWLEGLANGIQAALAVHQAAAQQQLAQLLDGGARHDQQDAPQPAPVPAPVPDRSGSYL